MKSLFLLPLVSICALVTSGCAGFSGLAAQNQATLAQGKPIAMCTLACECFVVQSGLPIPFGQRMDELDGLCKAKWAPPILPAPGVGK